jgi:4-oxalocrotonate tautomerase
VPFITVKAIEGVFTDPQKAELIQKVTDAVVSVEGENMRGITWVVMRR